MWSASEQFEGGQWIIKQHRSRCMLEGDTGQQSDRLCCRQDHDGTDDQCDDQCDMRIAVLQVTVS